MNDIITLTSAVAEYPQRICVAMPDPPTLGASGCLDLLERDAIGICGSRNASDEALRYAYRFGKTCAENGFVVVSGHARGVDREAQRGALESGGKTIAVLPEGINGLHIVRDLQQLVDPESNFLAVSMYEANASWATWRAMERNKLIVGLSLGLLVVEARETGGTINAAYECARQGKPLAAVKFVHEDASRAGNRELLLQDKAVPLESREDLLGVLNMAAQGNRPLGSQIPFTVV